MARFWKLKGDQGPEFIDPDKIVGAYWDDNGQLCLWVEDNNSLSINDPFERAFILGWFEQRAIDLSEFSENWVVNGEKEKIEI